MFSVPTNDTEYDPVVVLLIDSTSTNLKDAFAISLMNELKQKLSMKQSLNVLIENQTKQLLDISAIRDIKLIFSNVQSKYTQIIDNEPKRKSQTENGDLEIPYCKMLEKQFTKFDWKTAITLISEFKNNEFFAKLFLSSCVKSYFFQFLEISNKHTTNDRTPCYSFTMIFVHSHYRQYLDGTIKEHEYLARFGYPLKVVVLAGKHILEWTENGFVQISEMNDSIYSSSCLRVQFFYSIKQNEISKYFNKLIEFNCKWNASMFYNPDTCNTGHYVLGLIRYLNFTVTEDANILLESICKTKKNIPLELEISNETIDDYVIDWLKANRELKWVRSFLGCTTEKVRTKLSSWEELSTFCNFFVLYSATKSHFLDIERLLVFLMVLLDCNHETIKGEYLETLTLIIKKHTMDFTKLKTRSAFHLPLYNFPDRSVLQKSILSNDTQSTIKYISLLLQFKK